MTDTESEFKQANKLSKEQTSIQIRERISNLWALLGDITVWCPACKNTQKVKTTKTVKCFHCGHSYKVYPKNAKCRVAYVKPGKIALLHEIRSLEVGGKYTCIL